MALYRRGDVWWMNFTTVDGRRIRQSCKTTSKKEARELYDKRKAESWRIGTVGVASNRTWREAAERWLSESGHKAHLRNDRAMLRWLEPRLGSMSLRKINRDLLCEIANVKAREASEATANHYLALIRAILRKAAYEWEWIEQPPKVRMFKQSPGRIRWLTHEQAAALIKELPAHQAPLMRFALATGLRKANVLGLKWSQVDMARRTAWIHADQAKARRAIAVPLNEEAMSVLQGELGKSREHVFTYNGAPIKQVNTKAWQKALKRAGISNFRWHDLRHTWASWHVQAGTPLHVLQELGGWQTADMVRRYGHLSADHLAKYADNGTPRHNSVTAKRGDSEASGLTT